MKTAILILAAGNSSRMGKSKQLLTYKHTTLLGWSIEQAQASKADEVVCVLGANVQEIEKSIKDNELKIIYNLNPKEGLSSSIICGIQELHDKDSVLIMLADQPHITADYLNRLMENLGNYPSKIIASVYKDTLGVPALFPKKYYSELLKLKGDKGAKTLLNQYSYDIVSVDSVNLLDIDTPEDYRRLR